MTIGSFALQLIERFPALGEVPIVELVPAIQPLYSAYTSANSNSKEINELQGDRL